jgi:hypothetical protein
MKSFPLLFLLFVGLINALSRPRKAFIRKERLGRALYDTFPLLHTVIETILFTTSGPMIIDFQDAFCNGSNFTVYDNGISLGTTVSPLPRFCGINVSSYTPIISPTFSHIQILFSTGFHNCTVVVMDSPLGNGSTALRITFKPAPPVKFHIVSQTRQSIRQ